MKSSVVRITSNGKSRNYIAFICETLSAQTASDMHVIILTAKGPSIAKAISVAEVVKTLVPGLHQLNELLSDNHECGNEKNDSDVMMDNSDDVEDEVKEKVGGSSIERVKTVMHISLSKSASALTSDLEHYGYQPPP